MARPNEPDVPPGAAAPREHRIGLVSDTHGQYLPALDEVLAGVEEILHAGDVGDPAILKRLQRLAPVTAVGGNVDVGVAGLALPAFARREWCGFRVLITHYAGQPEAPLPPVRAALERERPHLLLSGHTHQPEIVRHGETWFVNPGSCGPRRFKLPVSCGILTLRATAGAPEMLVRILDLEHGGELARAAG